MQSVDFEKPTANRQQPIAESGLIQGNVSNTAMTEGDEVDQKDGAEARLGEVLESLRR